MGTRLTQMPGHLIRRAQQIAVGLFAEEMAAIGLDLTPVQFAALSGIAEKAPIDQAALANFIAYDKATIGGVIDRLEAKNLLQRKRAPEDGRVWRLTLTAAGRAALARAQPAVARAQERILAPINPAERPRALALLRRLALEDE